MVAGHVTLEIDESRWKMTFAIGTYETTVDTMGLEQMLDEHVVVRIKGRAARTLQVGSVGLVHGRLVDVQGGVRGLVVLFSLGIISVMLNIVDLQVILP